MTRIRSNEYSSQDSLDVYCDHLLAHAEANQAGNAALRYWAAFSELRDSAITGQQAKEISATLEGTIPYEGNRFQELIQKNRLALEIMARGTGLGLCDWGLDYGLGADTPVEYAREALTLGKLNVLYALQLQNGGNREGVVLALVTGLRFSHDVGNGGSLLATLVAKSLLVAHLRVTRDVLRQRQLNQDQHWRLQTAVAASRLELDWSSAVKRVSNHFVGNTRKRLSVLRRWIVLRRLTAPQ